MENKNILAVEKFTDEREELKKLFELHAEIEELKQKCKTTEVLQFKNETNYLSSAKGQPLTKDCEFYIHGKSDKKSEAVDDEMRVFSLNYPGKN